MPDDDGRKHISYKDFLGLQAQALMGREELGHLSLKTRDMLGAIATGHVVVDDDDPDNWISPLEDL